MYRNVRRNRVGALTVHLSSVTSTGGQAASGTQNQTYWDRPLVSYKLSVRVRDAPGNASWSRRLRGPDGLPLDFRPREPIELGVWGERVCPRRGIGHAEADLRLHAVFDERHGHRAPGGPANDDSQGGSGWRRGVLPPGCRKVPFD